VLASRLHDDAPQPIYGGIDGNMNGTFPHRSVEIRWTFKEDGEYYDGKQWMFEVSLGDISVSRRFPSPFSSDEADREARKIAPELFRVAEEWLKE